MTEQREVLIVGGGPGGLQAARAAATQEIDTLVLEEHPQIGIPIACGEGISKDALNSFNLPIEDANYYRYEVKNLKVILPNNTYLAYEIDGVVINRALFDQYLGKLAQESGADIKTSHRVIDAKRTENGFHITAETQSGKTKEFNTKILIDATGPSARVSRMINHPHPTKHVYGIEYRMKGVHTESLDFYFDLKKWPKGYIWIFPKGENVSNVGIVVQDRFARKKLDEFIQEMGIEGEIEEYIGGTIPATGPITPTYEDHFLAVGDAAGMANAVFYGGNRIAMQTGKLAGEVAAQAIQKNDTSANQLKKYEKKWKKYPFASKAIPKTHHLFYEYFKNEHINDLGTTFNGVNLKHFPISGYFKLMKKTFTNKFYFKNILKFRTIVKGFQITSEWGY